MLFNWTDIVDGEIVNAAWALAQMVAKPRTSRRVAADLSTVAWADTERLIREALSGIDTNPRTSDLSHEDVAEVESAIKGHEVQGALQVLVAMRLTDASEADAAKARNAVRWALSGAVPLAIHKQLYEAVAGPGRGSITSSGSGDNPVPRLVGIDTWLSEYFDTKICGLVAMLEKKVGFAGLAQVRAEAYSARIVALLAAIERQITALADPGCDRDAQADWLARYRRQVHQRHGFLTPPDFDRRRRVPFEDIYVPTGIEQCDLPEQGPLAPAIRLPSEIRLSWDDDDLGLDTDRSQDPTKISSLNMQALVGQLGRTVLLGNPGGGKTTAASLLANRLASDSANKIPFFVVLRDYAAKPWIEWSIVEHIDQNLRTLYQSQAPEGLVDRMLQTGRAFVIFDGLDELLDTSRRRDVSDRVEQFCTAYPLTPVLVTSRVVGYDEALLDDSQFTCYRLADFSGAQAAEYVHKWFSTQEGISTVEAETKARAFLAESENATDLLRSPLLLSLMCILYRGAGFLPANRAGVYARCTELLLRKWDEQRDLYKKLKADHLIEPTLRYLAWWLYTRADSTGVASARELMFKTTEFLLDRYAETEDEARAAAREFVEFCRGRMWVFSDAGLNADGIGLYSFTHRTFMEYFAAWHLAVTADTPEHLADSLVANGIAWNTVGDLAIQIKGNSSDRGVDRIYGRLLQLRSDSEPNIQALGHLVSILESSRPSPDSVRKLTRAVLASGDERLELLSRLVGYGNAYEIQICDEISKAVSEMLSDADASVHLRGIRLVMDLAERRGYPPPLSKSRTGNAGLVI